MKTTILEARRGLSFVAVAILTALMFIYAPASWAADTGNIDKDKLGTITINKFVQPSNSEVWGTSGDGSSIPSAATDLNPIGGVKFSYKQLDYDLKTTKGWDDLEVVRSSGAEPAVKTGGKSGDGTTDNTGKITWSELPVGAYLVTEVTATGSDVTVYEPGGVGEGNEEKLTTSVAPFIVTIPTANPKSSEGSDPWLYNVNVYPKNSTSDLAKTAAAPTDGWGLGSTVEWKITQLVPEIAKGVDFKSYVITDALDPRLTYAGGTVSFAGIVADFGEGATSYEDGTPEKYAQDAAKLDGQSFSFDMIKAFGKEEYGGSYPGLDTAPLERDGNDGTPVTITLRTKVTGLSSGNTTVGSIPNEAAAVWTTLDRNSTPSQEVSQTLTTPTKVTSYWGSLEITKLDKTTHKPLKDAKFAIYAVPNSNSLADSAGVCQGLNTQNAKPILVSGVSGFASNDGGKVTIAGLYVSNSSNNGSADSTKTYCLVESEAPAGYRQNTTPVPVTIKAGVNSVTIANETIKTPSGALPTTGSSGRIILGAVGGGAILLAIGSALYLRGRKNSAK